MGEPFPLYPKVLEEYFSKDRPNVELLIYIPEQLSTEGNIRAVSAILEKYEARDSCVTFQVGVTFKRFYGQIKILFALPLYPFVPIPPRDFLQPGNGSLVEPVAQDFWHLGILENILHKYQERDCDVTLQTGETLDEHILFQHADYYITTCGCPCSRLPDDTPGPDG